jgi:hypothetical protein
MPLTEGFTGDKDLPEIQWRIRGKTGEELSNQACAQTPIILYK